MTVNDHPFSIPLAELSSEELDKRLSDLLRRWQIARRMQMNQYVLHQLDLMLNSVELEKQRRAFIDDKPDNVLLDTDPIAITESKFRNQK